jgi:hypothetical protein
MTRRRAPTPLRIASTHGVLDLVLIASARCAHAQAGLLGTSVVAALLLTGTLAVAQPYGVDAPTPIAPFLDGVFPTTKPERGWGITNAFPNLTGLPPTVLVIVPNPADERLYIGALDGEIVSIANDPLVTSTKPFMDLRDRVATVWDGGFLGMAFHPEFAQPGSPHEFSFYAYFASFCPTDLTSGEVDFSACNPDYPQDNQKGYFSTWLRLSRFQAFWDPIDQVYKGDATSEQPLFNIRLYNNSHRGGGPVFGIDGLLYLAIGDQFRFETAQDIVDTLEGGTLRLAVDIADHGDGTWTCPPGSHLPRRLFQNVTSNPDEMSGRLYCIPDDNPWLDPAGGVMEEYYSLGHRNPHRLGVDPVTGFLWSGEVGQKTREEVNIIQKGRNYGWPFREGMIEGVRPEPPSYVGLLTDPVLDFTREEAGSIIGGYVYRGSLFPELVGRYIAGDWVTRNVWAIDLDVSTMTATHELLTTFDPGGLATFGQDNDGEIYLGSVTFNIPLHRLERFGSGVPDPNPLLSQIGAFENLTTLEPIAAAIPFEPLQFWSDGATKQRWIFLPNDGAHDQPGEQILFSESDNWTFPSGTVLMKHFELPTDETSPSITTRLETRFLVLGEDDDWYGLTYRWRGDQSDADLLPDGATGDYTIELEGGGTRTQTWTFPSRTQCLACHNPGEGGPAGPRTHQLNRDLAYPRTGRNDNQLRTWNHLGMFTPALDEADISTYLSAKAKHDPSTSLELRARSYLDTNCSYCHRPETSNRSFFDARLTTPLDSQGLIWGGVIDALGIPDAYLIKPRQPLESLVLHRISALGAEAMPPLAKALVDTEGAALLYNWILSIDPGYPRQGLAYEYFEVTGLSALPDFDTLTPVQTGTVGTFDISLRSRNDDFAFRFVGVVDVPSDGDWTFYVSSDEGSQLWVDGALVVDNDGLHTSTEQSGTVFLPAGYHDIVVTMFEATGPESLNVSWEGPSTTKQQIAADRLFPEVPTPITNAPPSLTNPGAQQNDVSDLVSLQLAASDPDGDLLFFSASGLPPGLALDASTGVIEGTLAAGSPGLRTVTVGVSDGPAAASVSFDWNVDDAVAPTVSLSAPGAGVVSGLVLIQATAADAGGIVGVQFLLDGASLGAEDLVAPYELSWNSTLRSPPGRSTRTAGRPSMRRARATTAP